MRGPVLHSREMSSKEPSASSIENVIEPPKINIDEQNGIITFEQKKKTDLEVIESPIESPFGFGAYPATPGVSVFY